MNFMDILNTQATDIERPPLLPAGSYLWAVSKPHKESTTGNGEWNIIEIPVVPRAVDAEADDVDHDALAEFGSLAQGANSIRFMFPTAPDKDVDRRKAAFNLKQFLLDTLKVDADPGATIKELLAKSIGCEFRAQASHTPGENGNTFVNVKNWMSAD